MSAASIKSKFLKYSAFNVLGMLGLSCYILADTFFVANGIGADGLAALNLAIPVYSFIHGCALMIGIGSATKYTIAQEQGEQNRADFIFTNSMYLSAIFAACFMFIGLLFSEELTELLGANDALFDMTNIYLKVILLFAPFFICNEVLLSFVRNDHNPGLAMFAMISGSISNVILDYIFIYPFQMGILGAVLATGIAPVISMMILSILKLRRKNQFHLRKFPIHPESIFSSLILGFPSFVTEASSGIVMIIFNLLILGLAGTCGVTAYGIIANIALVTTAIFTGIAQGVQPLISASFGTGEHHTTKVYLKYALGSVLCISFILYSAITLFHTEITYLFNSENDFLLQSIAETGLLLYFTSLPFVGYNVILSTFFTSTETPLPAHIISMLRGLIIVIPMAYLLSSHCGLKGIWLTVTITEVLTALVGAVLWHKRTLIVRKRSA